MATNDVLDEVSPKVEESYSLGEKDSIEDMNHHLFNALRSLDYTDATIILAQASVKEGAGLAYMNRLEKASSATKKELQEIDVLMVEINSKQEATNFEDTDKLCQNNSIEEKE